MIRLTGGFTLAAPPERAFHYFTPLGEKEWAPGWDPRFPADDQTVFETGHGHRTTWVTVDNVPGQRIRYARVAHGMSELVELIMRLGFAHASAAGNGRRKEAMA